MRLVFSRCFYSNYYSTVTYYSCSESVDTTVMVLVEVRTYNLSAASSDLTTRQKHALNKYNEPLETKLTALSCCWQKSILSWKTFSMEKLLWKDWEMLIGVLELLVRLARCKLSISPSMKWSLVSRTLWWALTQLSHRYSWQSRQWEGSGVTLITRAALRVWEVLGSQKTTVMDHRWRPTVSCPVPQQRPPHPAGCWEKVGGRQRVHAWFRQRHFLVACGASELQRVTWDPVALQALPAKSVQNRARRAASWWMR